MALLVASWKGLGASRGRVGAERVAIVCFFPFKLSLKLVLGLSGAVLGTAWAVWRLCWAGCGLAWRLLGPSGIGLVGVFGRLGTSEQ